MSLHNTYPFAIVHMTSKNAEGRKKIAKIMVGTVLRF